ncbi:bifunctional rhamnulose-1-phosphate aldolase/short-chain dehydrogenase [Herbaspirillum seropedicae]|uniref:Sugar phosphate dehydrogenase oxidoreductase protein n=1 Tax=Herbaspirillum seropedicae (strain SmR1) TaxID=757424 RepID=D8IVV7_HERSS|nr:bifunctional rhamnulose-1-phosphate aldolase/short-chain dehydrogenase [Herbaspirillum seropedicae]ADJ65915.1 sugar phosphate dehydrogenase oxidoreductase protein [Herbaspirillum seropedicae SmR1]AKN67700.1 short-chain dehydrogenase [Herbaspirillum seropedicae]UMU23722.1 bifunctional rhamnulose-1-phosphate aldolase/short-chain dehydrogenase [Herbaspirillum seropedicae]
MTIASPTGLAHPKAGQSRIASAWDEAYAATLDEPQLLLYRSNLLGADKEITNFGGGNTSAKIAMPDPLTGQTVEVLWVKGSGGDLGSIKLDGFATLYMDKLEALRSRYRGLEHEDEMVGYLPHCTYNLNARAASIDTPLHAYIPRRHVDHMHPDAVIAIAACKNSRDLTARIFEGELGWLPWQRPGYDLGLKLEQLVRAQPHLKGIVLEGHGLFTWGDSARECYENTLNVIRRADAWLAANSRTPAFGGARYQALPKAERAALAARIMPLLRGKISKGEYKLGHFDDSQAVLDFVCSNDLAALAALGTSCPDHFLRTKIRPLVLDFSPQQPDLAALEASLDAALEAYRQDYAAYYQRCARPNSPAMRDPNPVIYLIPGVGMLSFAKDKATARIAGEFYINAVNVMRGANGVDSYVGLPEQEAFDIEYWLLEEAKLQRMPKPKSLAGRIALVTGGGGGIGQAVARQLLAEGACVMLTDIDQSALDSAQQSLLKHGGPDAIGVVRADITSEADVTTILNSVALRFGGIDLLVSNAGIASASPLQDTSLEVWQRNLSVLATGYFLVSRAAFSSMLTQGLGGSIVYVASKNGLVASAGASAYCTAKAAEIHLARCIALEGAPHGIRVNVVNPDAVIRGSRIWDGKWKEERAASNKIEADDVEEFYRQRSMLKRSVLPEDIAEAVYFFASEKSAKSTGNILNVDAGNAGAFTR